MSRKYRQRGYMDDDGEERRKKRSDRPRPQHREGPKGRGLAAAAVAVFRCNACGQKVHLKDEIDFGAVCPNCEAALHACVNCRYFDPSATWECRQEITERVPKKRKGNTCEKFAAKVTQEVGTGRGPEDPKAAFDALFDF